MAVSEVKLASIIGVQNQLDRVVNICGESGFFQPEDALTFYSDIHKFIPLYKDSPFEEPLQLLKETMRAAGKTPTRTSDPAPPDDQLAECAKTLSEHMQALFDRRSDLEKKRSLCYKSRSEISHFLGLELNLTEIFACEYIKVRFGRIPHETYDRLADYGKNPYVLFFRCTSDDTHYWGVYFAPVEYIDEVDRIFSGLYFERIRISSSNSTPEERFAELTKELEEINRSLHQVQEEIDRLWKDEGGRLCACFLRLEELNTYYHIRKYVAGYSQGFILVGWIPAEEEQNFMRMLEDVDGIDLNVETADHVIRHEPPVKLRNRRFFRPFEFFVDMYGLPRYGEVDPTPMVAVTFVLLFGIMFGDLGQGLLVSLVGYLMWKLKKMPLGKILLRCGVSSAFFGLVFGSVFGFEHALDPLYQAMGFASKPIEVMDPLTTNYIIYTAVGIGFVLILIAMLINIYASLKRRDYESGVFGPNGIAGFLFYASLVLGLVMQIALGVSIMTPVYIILLIVLPLISIFLREPLGKLAAGKPNWKPEKWGDYIMQNLFELIELLLSYATNTISFMRVGAFVLVHAGMMMVVFTLAEMSSGIGYILILIIGNVVVSAMEGLLVCIQVLRLEFYEMFSRFFEGGGKPFLPIRIHKDETN